MERATRRSVSVIICAYTEDRWGQLVSAVESATVQSYPAEEIVVVIDHNPTLLARARSRFPEAWVVENRESAGLSGARNSGVAAARGDIAAFLDDDAAAAPDWLERLCSWYDDSPVVGVGGFIEPDWEAGRPTWFPPEFDWVVGCSYRGVREQAGPVRNLIGANMSFRRDLLLELGGFVTGMGRIGTLPAGCEETELCIRAQQRWPDAILIHDPAAVVRHQVPAKRGSTNYFTSRCYAEGQSKARVSQLVGRRDGLRSEFTYTLKTLTRGVVKGFLDFATRKDPSGAARSLAIVVGLGLTTAGFLVGTGSTKRLGRRESPLAPAAAAGKDALGRQVGARLARRSAGQAPGGDLPRGSDGGR